MEPDAGATGISVIIPARNEAPLIGSLVAHLRRAEVREVIVVDGQSEDETAERARRAGAIVLSTPPGRGRQLSLGAQAARGEVLLFLHADTRLPARFERHIRRLLDRPDVVAGAFTLRIDGAPRALRWIEAAVAWRSRRLRLPYGDQALFMRAETFEAAGGFASLPVMEDVELVCRLRRRGRIEIAPAAVVTSARRWLEHGIWRTVLTNQLCIGAYRLGVAPERIAAWRERKQPARQCAAPGPVAAMRARQGA